MGRPTTNVKSVNKWMVIIENDRVAPDPEFFFMTTPLNLAALAGLLRLLYRHFQYVSDDGVGRSRLRLGRIKVPSQRIKDYLPTCVFNFSLNMTYLSPFFFVMGTRNGVGKLPKWLPKHKKSHPEGWL